MPLGLSDKFDILRSSPLDSPSSCRSAEPAAPAVQRWVPSRYNVRATAEDGRLVLWNTLSGKMTVFKPSDRAAVLALLRKKGLEAPKEKVIEYLADRGHLVREGVDEYRQFQKLFGQAQYRSDALELILMASEDCNFRCTYCYEDFARGTMTPAVREGIKNLVRKRVKKLNLLNISWFGGEPLYGWEAVEDLAPFFLDIARENEVGFSSIMTTNAYLLTPDVAEKLLSWEVRNYQITLDGLPEHHDHSRVARDGSPTFDRVFGNLKALAARDDGFSVTIRVNYDRVNSKGLPEFVDLLSAEFGNDRRFNLALRAVGKWGGPNDAQLDVCGGDESARVQRDILALARAKGLHFGSLRDIAHPGSQVCYAARPYNFLIGATGKVMKCTIVLDKDEYNVVGQVTPEGNLELDQDRMALWTEPVFEHDKKCRKCVVLPTCQGLHCPLIRFESHTQPCISTRSNPKGELLAALAAPGRTDRTVQVGEAVPQPAALAEPLSPPRDPPLSHAGESVM